MDGPVDAGAAADDDQSGAGLAAQPDPAAPGASPRARHLHGQPRDRAPASTLGAVGLRAQQTAPPPRILVVPFENVAREGRIFWLTEAAAVLLADDLNALGASAITRGERHQAFERLQVPPAAALTDATVIRIGQLVGAAQVVVGSLRLDAESIVVRARSIALDSGRIVADVTERGSLPELFAIFERIARRIAPPSARTSEELA